MSLSTAHRELTLVMSLIDSARMSIDTEYAKRKHRVKMLALTAKLAQSVQAVLDGWNIRVDSHRHIELMERRIDQFYDRIIDGPIEMEIPLSVGLALIERSLQGVKDPGKRAILEAVEAEAFKIVRYLDPKLAKHALYEKAAQCLACWDELRLAA